ncbi:bifunctional [glutamate--ammonia ligase]-adenylyl-L-tyrosine phosphorylase/[glutamate--ammonia-ligase] adenylyltransferase [Pseudoalteromonas sp. CO325X]|uniref:bifunctional [glutamate--ammonia ligase]-adenylyl-L-tyrosine phosphorylase/[glutamate--ammonia-ligase] adenylyltransferase n=1 Tax=Pseudoalteromonas sp. CO325X TaxID=1777262 RepID=UPI001023BE7E|nr:bifunctional [glutamate--ammonia ligase]-adenylyl-L-tyrosine phosphorylase/[glutamate--ammonia-ligase] adenylyltransferase [Pseudoalteromonas sp. CO325X]RZF77656.1 bifunctional [glutamate--ammonia ligase]-adenylyl-L-tyrosine phosphorylase/[glutamate--ammonia-ligase] adenylyltransferase [Pseudoalteromonas sp. CO325X]
MTAPSGFNSQLQQLGKDRYEQIYGDTEIDNDLLQLLALSDFAYDVLSTHKQWGAWLVDPEQQQCRAVPDPLPQQLGDVSETQALTMLRCYRQQYWLKVAYLDLVCGNDIADSMAYVSALSDTLIDAANRWAFAQVAKVNGAPVDEHGHPIAMMILGMGKLGGKELNYSSDIDLIFTYPLNTPTQGGRRSIEAQVFYTKVAQKVIAALDQHTVDGRVFRVDMRLRPFGDSGPLVMSFSAMEAYYQEQGREWERYAMLKGRLIHAPCNYVHEFNEMLRPFVYRRYIDFSVIESLRKMKSLIAQEVRRKGLQDNIKLGAGGIREVEFIVQALQLIRGGREPQLQTQSLAKALAALTELGVFTDEQQQQLWQDYALLRQVEQYLQAFNDEQTQQLPQSQRDWLRLNTLLNQANEEHSRAVIEAAMGRIRDEFEQVIGFEPEQGDDLDDSYTLAWEHNDTEALSDVIANAQQRMSWQGPLNHFHERVSKQPIGKRGRDTLDKLMPHVLQQLQHAHACGEVVALVTNVLDKIMSRTAYLELLLENPGALQQLVRLCAHSRWIGEHIAHYPILLDELIDPAELYNPFPLDAYSNEIRQYFLRIDEHDLEMQMEALRQFKQTQQLRIAAADATGALPVMKVSDHLSALAEAIIEQAVNLAWQQMVARFGKVPGTDEQHKGFAVIAYGKAGGLELGYDSDLDLVFVHNHDGDSSTDGDKSISARQFYLKLAQRLMHLFNTRTSSGILYELDTRLRPEGSSGLLAINIESFLHYQQTQAWTWEHQALVRARMVYGISALRQRFSEIRIEILAQARQIASLRDDVTAMREKMRRHLNRENEFMLDLKQGVGGMTDIEFITQFLVLAHAHHHPALLEYSDNIRILEAAAHCGCISERQTQQLIHAYCHYRGLYHVLSLRNQEKMVAKIELQDEIASVSQIWEQLFAAPK